MNAIYDRLCCKRTGTLVALATLVLMFSCGARAEEAECDNTFITKKAYRYYRTLGGGKNVWNEKTVDSIASNGDRLLGFTDSWGRFRYGYRITDSGDVYLTTEEGDRWFRAYTLCRDVGTIVVEMTSLKRVYIGKVSNEVMGKTMWCHAYIDSSRGSPEDAWLPAEVHYVVDSLGLVQIRIYDNSAFLFEVLGLQVGDQFIGDPAVSVESGGLAGEPRPITQAWLHNQVITVRCDDVSSYDMALFNITGAQLTAWEGMLAGFTRIPLPESIPRFQPLLLVLRSRDRSHAVESIRLR